MLTTRSYSSIFQIMGLLHASSAMGGAVGGSGMVLCGIDRAGFSAKGKKDGREGAEKTVPSQLSHIYPRHQSLEDKFICRSRSQRQHT